MGQRGEAHVVVGLLVQPAVGHAQPLAGYIWLAHQGSRGTPAPRIVPAAQALLPAGKHVASAHHHHVHNFAVRPKACYVAQDKILAKPRSSTARQICIVALDFCFLYAGALVLLQVLRHFIYPRP